jgi:predicted metal-dependent phosphoesterase TrpH
MPGFLVDLHCHTLERSYDGQVRAAEIIARLVQLGFAGLVVTDHARVWPAEALREAAQEARAPEGFLLLSGQEVRTTIDGATCGDMLVYGPEEDIPDGASPLEIIKMLKACGGFAIAPHPAAPGVGLGDRLDSFPGVIAAEVWNGRYGPGVAAASRALAERVGMTAVGGSDAHREREIGGGGTLFAQMPRSLADIREAILEGECLPWRPRRRLFGLF